MSRARLDYPDVVLSVSSLGHYRGEFIAALRERLGPNVLIVAGRRAKDSSIRVLTPPEVDVAHRNLFLGPVEWTGAPVACHIQPRVLVLDFAPRSVRVWLATVLRRVLGRRTILWGHAWPRRGPDSSRSWARLSLAVLAGNVVVYTEQQRHELSRRLKGRADVWAAPNALYSAERMQFATDGHRNSIIYCGRLVKEKRVDRLIRAYAQLPTQTRRSHPLTIIGDGPERDFLETLSLKLQAEVRFLGEVNDAHKLEDLYKVAICSVTPGYVGLSVTQSLGFGVPVVYSQNEQHSPEISALNAINSLAFVDLDDLTSALGTVIARKEVWKGRGSEIALQCASEFSVDAMVAGMISAIEGGPV